MESPSHKEPDAEEKRIRFGCGALIGIPLGVGAAAQWTRLESPLTTVLIVLAVACLHGVLAMRLGDRYWTSFRDW